MSIHPMDTLTTAEQLEKLGFNDDQAKGLAKILFGHLTENLATKEDLEALKRELKADINALNTKVDALGPSLKRDLIIVMGGIMVAGITVIGFVVGL